MVLVGNGIGGETTRVWWAKQPGLKIEAKGFRISVFQARMPKFPRRYLLHTLEFKALGWGWGGGGGGGGWGGGGGGD